MTTKYTITLSDGVTTFDVYALEQNGPINVSTPRQVLEINLTGGAGVNYFKLADDLTYRFVAGFTFTVNNSGGADGTYTVVGGGSTFAAGETLIPVVETIPSDGLPLGDVTYSITADTSLLLPGRGTQNYGEHLLSNVVHILENFASTSPPPNPLVGQLWFDTSSNELKRYDGVSFTASTVVGAGSSIEFVDPQHPTDTTGITFELTGDETDVGVALLTNTDPSIGDSVFRVLDQSGSELLRVEYNGLTSTTNSIKTTGTADNEFAADIQFADTKGIKSATGATLITDATGRTWEMQAGAAGAAPLIVRDSVGTIRFQVRGDNHVEVINNLIVDTDTLYVDSVNDRVGINTSTPSTALHVVGNVTVQSQIQASDGTTVLPTYTFTSDSDTGMYLSAPNQITFSTNGSDKVTVDPSGAITVVTGYETLVTTDNHLTNKKYVDDAIAGIVVVTDHGALTGLADDDHTQYHNDVRGDNRYYTQTQIDAMFGVRSWREPVRVHDSASYANAAAFPTTGTIDGVLLNDQDRVLFSNVITITDRNIFVWDAGSTSWTEDVNAETYGDAVYVVDGTDQGRLFVFDVNDDWTELSGSKAEIKYETQTGLTGTPVINFSVVSYTPGDNALIVFLNGQKMIRGTDYNETSSTSITWIGTPLVSGDVLEFYSTIPTNNTPKPTYEEFVAGAGQTIFNTAINVGNNTSGGVGSIQVFVNGVYQMEGTTKNYQVTGANQITFNAGLLVNDDVVIYSYI